MGLLDVFDDVERTLNDTLASLDPPQEPPIWRRFTNEVPMEDDFPRIVWVIGRERIVGTDTTREPVLQQSEIWYRESHVKVHVWEEDVRAAEVLLNHFVAALHARLPGGYQATGGQWNAGEASNQRGVVYVLELSIYFPLTREPIPTVFVDDLPITTIPPI